MRKMFLFMMASLDGYIEGPEHDLSWHNVDAQFNDFAVAQLNEIETILMGRKTYQLMENYWPSTGALEDDPIVAEKMNSTAKLVVSHSLEGVVETEHWKNARLVKENVAGELAKLKEQDGKPIIVLGSNNLCVTLLELGLLDEIRIMVAPVAIGQGTPLFAGINHKIKFALTNTRTFANGNVLLTYEPIKKV